MIFITLGTQPCDFSRSMKMVEELIRVKGIKDEVIAQTGYTTYHPSCIKCFDFVTENEYQQYIDKADVVISHAGTGALFSSIKMGKKVIAVARLAKYGEMLNDHQVQIVKKLSSEGYILDGTFSILEAWSKLDNFVPCQTGFFCDIPNKIEEVLLQWGIAKK